MNSKTYLELSARTLSEGFHPENVNLEKVFALLASTIRVTNDLDWVKKALFYNSKKDFDATNHEEGKVDFSCVSPNILHAVLGIITEAGELLEAVYRAVDKSTDDTLDQVNLFEELGDLEWYMALLYRELNKTPEEAKAVNIAKLRKRYPEKFTTACAVNRNIEEERELLEQGMGC